MEEKDMRTDEQPVSDGKRSALLRYIVILFAVAFLLVSVSLIVQISSSNSVISNLSSSSSGAVARAEELQDTNRKLEAELEETKQTVAELTETLEKTQAEQKKQRAAHEAMLKILTTENPDGDMDYAKAVQTAQELREYLPKDAQTILDHLS